MHNLHYIVVMSDTPEEAVGEAEILIMDWGNENNWRCFGGCVSEDNEVYIHDRHSRWTPEENHTIEMINEQVVGWLTPDNYSKENFDKCVSGDIESPYNWYAAKKYCEHMFQRTLLGKDDFDVLQDEFFSWHINECGVTQTYHSQQRDDSSLKRWVVFVDMHD